MRVNESTRRDKPRSREVGTDFRILQQQNLVRPQENRRKPRVEEASRSEQARHLGPLFSTRITENNSENQLSNKHPYFVDSFIPVRPALKPWNFNTCGWTLSSGFTGVDPFLSFLGIRDQRVFVDKNGDAEVDLILMDMRWGYTGKLPFVYRTKCTVIEY